VRSCYKKAKLKSIYLQMLLGFQCIASFWFTLLEMAKAIKNNLLVTIPWPRSKAPSQFFSLALGLMCKQRKNECGVNFNSWLLLQHWSKSVHKSRGEQLGAEAALVVLLCSYKWRMHCFQPPSLLSTAKPIMGQIPG
jgi:hypothetical protein